MKPDEDELVKAGMTLEDYLDTEVPEAAKDFFPSSWDPYWVAVLTLTALEHVHARVSARAAKSGAIPKSRAEGRLRSPETLERWRRVFESEFVDRIFIPVSKERDQSDDPTEGQDR
ncbi:MAG: hypothetical protein V3U33_05710 [candidate division NC10 bacterium]